MSETTELQPGQVWADNDPRSEGRTLRVDRIESGKAVCTVLTMSDEATENLRAQQRLIESGQGTRGYPLLRSTVGKTVRISQTRFKPTSTGYRLVEAPEPVTVKEA